MNELQIFNNEEFGEMRGLIINGEPWFVGKDVAIILGYSNTRDAIRVHIDNEDKQQNDEVVIHDSIGRKQNPTIINESGVYSLIFGSKLPKAKEFKRWVTSEVLPAIRKTGGYIAGEENMTEDELILKAMQVLNSKVNTLKLENAKQSQIIKELKPKADYTDIILRNNNTMPVTPIAKDYGMSAKEFNQVLFQLQIQYKMHGQWLLYSQYQGYGYTHSKTISIVRRNGVQDCVLQTEWTQAGRLFLYEKLKSNGIVPLIERPKENKEYQEISLFDKCPFPDEGNTYQEEIKKEKCPFDDEKPSKVKEYKVEEVKKTSCPFD